MQISFQSFLCIPSYIFLCLASLLYFPSPLHFILLFLLFFNFPSAPFFIFGSLLSLHYFFLHNCLIFIPFLMLNLSLLFPSPYSYFLLHIHHYTLQPLHISCTSVIFLFAFPSYTSPVVSYCRYTTPYVLFSLCISFTLSLSHVHKTLSAAVHLFPAPLPCGSLLGPGSQLLRCFTGTPHPCVMELKMRHSLVLSTIPGSAVNSRNIEALFILSALTKNLIEETDARRQTC